MVKRPTIWDEIQRMHEQMDMLFESFFTGRNMFNNEINNSLIENKRNNELTTEYRQPITDIQETDKEYITTIELPGMNKKDIEINATEEGIEIRAEQKIENKKEDKKNKTYSYVKNYAGFYKHINLPEGINKDKISASYKNGVLEIKIPKTETKKKIKKINIE